MRLPPGARRRFDAVAAVTLRFLRAGVGMLTR
jgi:hypothetical protein